MSVETRQELKLNPTQFKERIRSASGWAYSHKQGCFSVDGELWRPKAVGAAILYFFEGERDE